MALESREAIWVACGSTVGTALLKGDADDQGGEMDFAYESLGGGAAQFVGTVRLAGEEVPLKVIMTPSVAEVWLRGKSQGALMDGGAPMVVEGLTFVREGERVTMQQKITLIRPTPSAE